MLGTETPRSTPSGEVAATHDMAASPPSRWPRRRRRSSARSCRCRRWCRRSRSTASGCTSWPGRAIEVEREPRPVTVHRFDVEPTDDPLVYRAEVDCSSGTYVRTLAADLGHALGGGAHLPDLRRTAVGSFTLAEARPLDD